MIIIVVWVVSISVALLVAVSVSAFEVVLETRIVVRWLDDVSAFWVVVVRGGISNFKNFIE